MHGPGVTWLWRMGELVASTGSAALVLALIFRYLPDADVSWHDVWAGATVTAVLFTLGKWGISAYLGASAVASTYGAAGALAIILLWVYYTSMVVLWGAEFTAVHAQLYGRFPDSRSAPVPDVVIPPKPEVVVALAAEAAAPVQPTQTAVPKVD